MNRTLPAEIVPVERPLTAAEFRRLAAGFTLFTAHRVIQMGFRCSIGPSVMSLPAPWQFPPRYNDRRETPD